MARRDSRLGSQQNRIDEFFDLCKDVDGTLHPDKACYALAHAYRGGFYEGGDLYRGRLCFEPRFSISLPEPVLSEKAELVMEERFLAELHTKGILPDQKAVQIAREKLKTARD